MPAGHIPSYLFAVLITSFCYGGPKSYPVGHTLIASVIPGIAVTLFAKSVATIVRKRRSTGRLNLPLVIPSVLIFIFATVVSFMVLGCQARFKTLSLSECYVHMDQHIYNFCCEWKWPLGLSGPYHNASEDDNSNWPSRSHSSGRCFGGTFAFTLATCHKS